MFAAYLLSAKYAPNRQSVDVYSDLPHPQAIWDAYAQSDRQNIKDYLLKVYSDHQDEAKSWVHTMRDTKKEISKNLPATERVQSTQTPSTPSTWKM